LAVNGRAQPDRTAKGQAREISDFGFWILDFGTHSPTALPKGKAGAKAEVKS